MHQLNKGFTINQMSFSRMQADRESMYYMSFRPDADLKKVEAGILANEERKRQEKERKEQLKLAENITLLKPGKLTKAAKPKTTVEQFEETFSRFELQ